MSGNPTRQILQHGTKEEARAHFDIPAEAQVLFMFGGSLGSAALNKAMESEIKTLLQQENLYVIWQTGSGYFDRVQQRVEPHDQLRLLKYVDRMDLAYALADVVLARSGAISCSELMVTGAPAVLVPSPNVAEDHQTKNAESMASAGAAVLLPERDLEKNWVNQTLELLKDEARRSP